MISGTALAGTVCSKSARRPYQLSCNYESRIILSGPICAAHSKMKKVVVILLAIRSSDLLDHGLMIDHR